MSKAAAGSLVEMVAHYVPNIKISLSDIKAPTREFLVAFYSDYFEEFGVDFSRLLQPSGIAVPVGKDPGLFQDILPCLRASKFINGFFERITDPQSLADAPFGLSDLITPTSSRTLAFLTIALNFIHFADSYHGTLRPYLNEVDERKKRLSELLTDRDKLKTLINERASAVVKIKDLTEQLKDERMLLNELRDEVKSHDLLAEKRETELKEIKTKILHNQELAVKLQDQNKALEMQLVSSPDALKSELLHLTQKAATSAEQLEEIISSAASKKELLLHLNEVSSSFEAVEASLTKVIAVSKEIEELKKKVAEMSQSNVDDLAKITTYESSDSEQNKLKKKLSNLIQQQTNLQLQWEKRKSGLEEQLRHAKEGMSKIEVNKVENLQNIHLDLQDKKLLTHKLLENFQKLCYHCVKMYEKLMEKEKAFIKKREAMQRKKREDFGLD